MANRALQRFRALRSATARGYVAAVVRAGARARRRRRGDIPDRAASWPDLRGCSAAPYRERGRLVSATFFALAAVMIVAALAFVLVPLLRHARSASAAPDAARRLRALDE